MLLLLVYHSEENSPAKYSSIESQRTSYTYVPCDVHKYVIVIAVKLCVTMKKTHLQNTQLSKVIKLLTLMYLVYVPYCYCCKTVQSMKTVRHLTFSEYLWY